MKNSSRNGIIFLAIISLSIVLYAISKPENVTKPQPYSWVDKAIKTQDSINKATDAFVADPKKMEEMFKLIQNK